MTNKIIPIVLAILIAGAAGYALSNNSEPKQQSSNNTAKPADTEPEGGKTLDLSGKQLTALPDYVVSDKSITTLNISNNQLASLPPEIAQMTNLQVLNVENNRLTSLPIEIGQMKSLKNLDVSNNRLTDIPSELGNLTGLSILKISGNNIPASDLEQLKAKLSNTEVKT